MQLLTIVDIMIMDLYISNNNFGQLCSRDQLMRVWVKNETKSGMSPSQDRDLKMVESKLRQRSEDCQVQF